MSGICSLYLSLLDGQGEDCEGMHTLHLGFRMPCEKDRVD